MKLQVLALSETHGRADKPSLISAEDYPGFNIWTTERSGLDKGGGGLAILYSEQLSAHQYCPAVPAGYENVEKERQWLLISSGAEKCAFLHVYIACVRTDTDDYLYWNEQLFHLITSEAKTLKEQGFFIFSLGDYNTRLGQVPGLENNTPDTNPNTPMFLTFLEEVNLLVLNTLPMCKEVFTRFMDGPSGIRSRALLDYGLISEEKMNYVSSFAIDQDARVACGSDHALLDCTIKFSYCPK